MAKYRVGVVACGSIARAHARGWTANADTEIVALADTNPDALVDFGGQFDVPSEHHYADMREMMRKEQPDIVSVCSWHPQHAEMVIAVAQFQPKLILCEKPMAANLQQADQMIVACRRNQVKLAIGHQRRFYSGWITARDLVAQGAIGQPKHVWSFVLQGLLNWGTHTIDCMRFVLGEPKTEWVMGNVERKTDRYERAIRIEDRCAGIIGFEGGVQAVVENDMTTAGSINCHIEGTDGILDIDENAVRLFNAETNGWRTIENPRNNPFVDQAQGLVDWLDGKVEDYRGEGEKARAVIEIMMAIYESARCHEVVQMPLQTRLAPLDLMVEAGQLPVERPGKYDIRSFLVRGEGMSW